MNGLRLLLDRPGVGLPAETEEERFRRITSGSPELTIGDLIDIGRAPAAAVESEEKKAIEPITRPKVNLSGEKIDSQSSEKKVIGDEILSVSEEGKKSSEKITSEAQEKKKTAKTKAEETVKRKENIGEELRRQMALDEEKKKRIQSEAAKQSKRYTFQTPQIGEEQGKASRQAIDELSKNLDKRTQSTYRFMEAYRQAISEEAKGNMERSDKAMKKAYDELKGETKTETSMNELFVRTIIALAPQLIGAAAGKSMGITAAAGGVAGYQGAAAGLKSLDEAKAILDKSKREIAEAKFKATTEREKKKLDLEIDTIKKLEENIAELPLIELKEQAKAEFYKPEKLIELARLSTPQQSIIIGSEDQQRRAIEDEVRRQMQLEAQQKAVSKETDETKKASKTLSEAMTGKIVGTEWKDEATQGKEVAQKWTTQDQTARQAGTQWTQREIVPGTGKGGYDKEGNYKPTTAEKSALADAGKKYSNYMRAVSEMDVLYSILTDKNISEEQKAVSFGGMLRLLNEPGSSDAIQREEVRRLSPYTTYHKGNLFEPGPFWGRDIPEATKQLLISRSRLKAAADAAAEMIDSIESGKGVPIISDRPASKITKEIFNKFSDEEKKEYVKASRNRKIEMIKNAEKRK